MTEEMTGEQDAIQLEVRGLRWEDWDNQFCLSAIVH